MPKSREHEPARIKEHLSQRGKEQITNVDNSRTDEKMVTTKPEAEKTEAPKKKKNIIPVKSTSSSRSVLAAAPMKAAVDAIETELLNIMEKPKTPPHAGPPYCSLPKRWPQ